VTNATFSFVCPLIYEIGHVHGWLYSIENRIPGHEMAVVLSGLAPEQREQAFANYLHAVTELRAVTYPDRPYGELLKRHPLRASSWREFLHASIEASIAANQVPLASDVTDLDAVVATARTALATIPEPPKALVHGDYFPKNVMLAEDLRVSGIIDFSPMTVVGDPLMDVAGGLLFLEVLDTYQPADSEILSALIRQEYGAGIVDIIEAYRLYYSFYFAGAWRDDTRLYAWCVSNLKRAAATHGA